MAKKKPTVGEIIEVTKHLREDVYGTLFQKYAEDEKMHELDFKDQLGLPFEFKDDGIVLPTARNVIDTAVDHTDIGNARVFVNYKGTRHPESQAGRDEQMMLRKFALGLIHRTNVESSLSPWRIAARHFWMHGLAVLKTVWDPDTWPNKPPKSKGESDESYNKKIDEWRYETHKSIPIQISAVNPCCILPDPATGGQLFVIEFHERMRAEADKMWPHWGNPKERDVTQMVECISYWDDTYRCEIVDGEAVLKTEGGVYEHKYGFIPYTLIESGLGNISKDSSADVRYVGIIRYITDLLIGESRLHSLADILFKREVLKGGWLSVPPDVGAIPVFKQAYGEYQPLPAGVEPHDWDVKVPPDAMNYHLSRTADYIAGHAAPRSVRGLSETGVRAAADRRLVIAEASAKYQYSKDAFRNGTSNVLTKATLLLKNKVPGDVRVWARTPTDEIDVVIEKDKLHEPFVYFVEFAPVSEEDEYRRHDDLERLITSGIGTIPWARRQMSNVDADAMELEDLKEKLKQDPSLAQMTINYAAAVLARKLSDTGIPPGPQGQPMNAPQQGQQQIPGRMTTGVPNVAVPGSAEAMQNQMAGMRSNTPMFPGQGMGGGGSRA